ncbi:hypothetical protein ACFUT3_07460 [Streptomyces cinereoruber]|uniref:hypothetical protein n=1 Tax=Streptomyces cinereoruber TaxID=67260 RepID=UPI003637620F
MRDAIARAHSWALSLLVPRRPGRHSAAFLAGRTEPVRTEAPARSEEPVRVDPWSKPWPTPTPAHVRDRYAPLRGEDVSLTRPYCRVGAAEELGVICERRRAAVLATLGVDWPYGYEGDQFAALAAAATAVPA